MAATKNDDQPPKSPIINQNQFGGVRLGDNPTVQSGAQIAGGTIINEEERAYDVRGLRNPYRGLSSFTYVDSALFAGRGELIKSIAARMTTPGARQTVLFLTGASGSGKSSLAMAGLLPALEVYYATRYTPVGKSIFRPGAHPLAALQDALAQLGVPPTALSATPLTELADAAVVRNLLALTPAGQMNLVVLDQFEECFSAQVDPNERSSLLTLIETLPSLVELPLHLLITLRIDYLPDLFSYAQLYSLAASGIAVREMRQDELKEAIQRPLQVLYPDGFKRYDPDLLGRLAADASKEATYLPLLQVSLESIWRSGWLKLSSYHGLGVAIEQRAEEVLTGQTSSDELRVRPLVEQNEIIRIFLDLIEVSLDEDAGRDVRVHRAKVDLIAQVPEYRHLIDELITNRLLSVAIQTESGSQIEMVGIIHESLIRNWARLQDAIKEKRYELQQRSRFELAVRDWVVNKQADDYLLTGIRLAEARLLAERGDIALHDQTAKLLLQRSNEKSLAEQEAQREHELEQARAKILRDMSVAQRLAFAAGSQTESAPETALLLACEALLWDHNPLSEGVVRDALDQVSWHVTGFVGHWKDINSVVFNEDGQLILTASDDRTARVWDVTGNTLHILSGHKDAVESAVFSPDGKLILTTSRDATARLWSLDGQLINILSYPTKSSSFLGAKGSFSPDGKNILVCTREEAWLWTLNGELRPMTWDARSRLEESWLSEISNSDPWKQVWQVWAEGHTESIYSAVFSPNSQFVLTASADKTARVWSLSGEQHNILQGHQGLVINAVFSPPDGQLIVTGSLDKTAKLWNSAGQLVETLEGHMADVGHLAFSPDGQLLLTAADGGGGKDAIIRLWDIDGKLRTVLKGHNNSNWIKCIAFSPDSKSIASGSDDETVRLWDTEGRTIAVLRGHLGSVVDLAFSPDGKRIVTASRDRTARVWEIAGAVLPTLETHTGSVTDAIYSSDGMYILTSSHSRTCLWSSAGRLRAIYPGKSDLLSDVVSHLAGSYLLTVQAEARKICIWQLPSELNWFTESATADINKDLSNSTTESWAEETPDKSDGLVLTLYLPQEEDHSLLGSWEASFSPGARQILAIGKGTAYLWNQQGKRLAELAGPNLNHREKRTVDFAMFCSDSQRILSGSINGTVWVWTIDGELITSFLTDAKFSGDNLFSLTFSPDGQRILTTIRHSADLWDRDGQHLVQLPCDTNKVKRGLFSPKGDRILTVGEAAFPDLRLWDGDGRLIKVLLATGGEFALIKFDPEGNRLCIVNSNVVSIWDRDGEPIAKIFAGKKTRIRSIDFSPDRESILLANSNGTAELWAIRDGGILKTTFKGHTAEVNSAVFSPDGKRVLTTSSDGTARQFLVEASDLLASARHRVGRPLNEEEVARFNVPVPLRFASIDES